MENSTIGKSNIYKKLWWLKVNNKMARTHLLDGAVFPSIIKVAYEVNSNECYKIKYIKAGFKCTNISNEITVIYKTNNPSKCRIELN